MTSWNAYKLVDHNPPEEITYSQIFKGLKSFEKHFKVDFQPNAHPSFLSWDLKLEEKKVSKQRTRSVAQKEGAKSLPPVIRKYTFAFSPKEEILFMNKALIQKLQNPLRTTLHCNGFEKLTLAHGIPTHLLMLYNQAKERNPDILELQYQEGILNYLDGISSGHPLVAEMDRPSEEHKNLHLSIGSLPEKIPQIKKLCVDVRNMPITTKNPKLEGYRYQEISVEVSGPSVFHMYKTLVEENIIKDTPPWLKKMRARGSYHCNAHYT
ncbi:hypothetical protein SK128_006800 [Halocaridina rubra]|uniref:Uncharacterized protein n=1 Tax=Halocaridina rubra TaxID=373956 RepID=A0AAN8WT57_HALRR